MKPKPLVSIIILSYKNYHYIYETLASVLSQDYDTIEIVVSNDGSDDFDKTAVNKYLQKNKKSNIKNIVINNNSKNLGTVKNINKAIKLSKGEYIIMIAADDVMYENKTTTKLINAFNTLPKNELIVISQVGMYDINLKKLIQLFLPQKFKEKIKNLSPQKLFAEMSNQCILPGCGICYKREIFKKYGYFDEKYVLVEDYSSALKLSRLGIKYNFFDFISCKHRDGGISHGNINGENKVGQQYELDILNIFKNEVFPYLNLLTPKQKDIFLKTYKYHEWKYLYNYKYKNGTKTEKRKFVLENFNTIKNSFFDEFFRDIKDQFKGKKFKIFLLGLIIFVINYFKILNIFYSLIMFFGLFLIIISFLLTINYFIKKYFLRIYQFIKIFL